MPPPPPPAICSSSKRKKWTEEEERSLIEKYAEMQSNGILSRMSTREKKFRPIASHVNAVHHSIDSVSYPFLWSWKDVSTKIQNMRHQFLLVKQKILLISSSNDPDWSHGLSLWPNFIRYRDVFGDLPLKPLGLGLGFECSDEERKKKKGGRRREEREREWEERMERRREEWEKRMDGMMEKHREEMEEMRARALQEQQAVVNQLVGIISNWAAGGGGGDVAGMGMLHVNVNGIVPGENRGGSDGADDQFIVE